MAVLMLALRRPVYRWWRQLVTRDWVPAKGVLDYAYVGRSGRFHSVCAGYTYAAEGRTWKGIYEEEFAAHSYAVSFCEYLKSVPAAVRYNPSSPGRSVLSPSRKPKARGFRIGRRLPGFEGVLDVPPMGISLAAWVFGLLGLLWAVPGCESSLRRAWRNRVSARWPLADADIETGEVETDVDGYRVVVDYSYRVRNARYTGKYEGAFSNGAEAHILLNSLKAIPAVVRYNPAAPRESVMDPFRDPCRTSASSTAVGLSPHPQSTLFGKVI